MNIAIKKKLLESLKNRCVLLHPETAARLTGDFDSMIQGLASVQDGDGMSDKMRELLDRAYNKKDMEAMQELNSIRMINIQNFITAKANAMAFFEQVVLLEKEVAYYKNQTTQEVRVLYIGSDGAAEETQAIKSQTEIQVQLQELSSDEVEVPIRDLNKGIILDQAQANYNISYDMEMKKNAILWALIDLACGAFDLTGEKAGRTYNLHSSVNAGNLPTSNLITAITGNSGSSNFRFDVIRAAVQYCSSFGNNALSIGEIVPVTLYVPSSHIKFMLDEIDIDSIDNAFVQEIKDYGYVVSLAGKKINIVGDATLNPDNYAAYLKTNVVLGQEFSKPSLSRMYPASPAAITKEEDKANRVKMSMVDPYTAIVPPAGRLGVAKFVYRTL